MFKNKKPDLEDVIIMLLWITLITTGSFALLMGYKLNLSDLTGFVGLVVVTITSSISKAKLTYPLLILLFVGMLNLATFECFLGAGIKFGVGKMFTPGIQFYSFVLFWILVAYRRSFLLKGIGKFKNWIVEDEDNKEKVEYFKKRFEKLTDQELSRKLNMNLTTEAILALKEIVEERNTDKSLNKK